MSTLTAKALPRPTADQIAQLAALRESITRAEDAIVVPAGSGIDKYSKPKTWARRTPEQIAADEAHEAAQHQQWDIRNDGERQVNAMLATFPTVGRQTLINRYDRYAPAVLRQRSDTIDVREIHPDREDAKRRPQAQYVIIRGEWPTVEQYQAMRDAAYTGELESLAEEAKDIFTELGDELRGWYDNLPEGLQSGDKGSMIEDAAQQMEDCADSDLTVAEIIAQMPVKHFPSETSSRSDRCAAACSILDDISGACSDLIDQLKKDGAELPDWCMESLPEGFNEQDPVACGVMITTMIEALDELLNECEEIKANAEGVEFPGMY